MLQIYLYLPEWLSYLHPVVSLLKSQRTQNELDKEAKKIQQIPDQ